MTLTSRDLAFVIAFTVLSVLYAVLASPLWMLFVIVCGFFFSG